MDKPNEGVKTVLWVDLLLLMSLVHESVKSNQKSSPGGWHPEATTTTTTTATTR